MMATPHLLAGAAIGRALHRRAWLALPTAFASHFVLDAIPHLGSNDLYGSPTGFTIPEVSIALADFAAGSVLLALLTRRRPWWAMAVWGGVLRFCDRPCVHHPALGTVAVHLARHRLAGSFPLRHSASYRVRPMVAGIRDTGAGHRHLRVGACPAFRFTSTVAPGGG